MPEKMVPNPNRDRDDPKQDQTPTSLEWIEKVEGELNSLLGELARTNLPSKETPIVRNTIEGLSVALRPVHRGSADLKKVLADLEA